MLVERWLPGQEANENNMSMALAMDNYHWQRMENTMAKAVAKGMGGK